MGHGWWWSPRKTTCSRVRRRRHYRISISRSDSRKPPGFRRRRTPAPANRQYSRWAEPTPRNTTMSDLLWQKPGVKVDARIQKFLAGEDVILDREFFLFDIQASRAHAQGLQRIGILSA